MTSRLFGFKLNYGIRKVDNLNCQYMKKKCNAMMQLSPECLNYNVFNNDNEDDDDDNVNDH